MHGDGGWGWMDDGRMAVGTFKKELLIDENYAAALLFSSLRSAIFSLLIAQSNPRLMKALLETACWV